MVQEYVEGETLEERLERAKQPLKEREVLIAASEVLDILDYLAQQTPPIVHRDIKPANIIIGARDKRAHLVDFGIARAEVMRNVQRKQTSALGTPGYAPPEQYQGNADPRSDLYALAATLHHLLTKRDPRNHPPFAYPPVRALNSQLSAETERMLTRALINDVSLRYQSAAAMKQDIDNILQQRFGISGNISNYMIGNSGAMGALGSYTLPNTIASMSGPMGPPDQSTMLNPPTPFPPMTPPPPPGQSYQAQSGGIAPTYPYTLLAMNKTTAQPQHRHTSAVWQRIMSSLSTSLQITAVQILSFIKRESRKKPLSLLAVARAELEKDDRASVGKTYMIEAGIAQNQPARFTGAPFTLLNQNRIDPIWFDLVVHSSDNIDLGESWHQRKG